LVNTGTTSLLLWNSNSARLNFHFLAINRDGVQGKKKQKPVTIINGVGQMVNAGKWL
jgi:hypothetical protein